jgi:hypothetical protein
MIRVHPSPGRTALAVKYRVFQQGEDWRVELHAVPRGHLRYTTNGADPVASGGAYDTPFTLPAECRFVLAVAEDGDIRSNVEKIDVVEYRTKKVAVDAALPALWSHPHRNLTAAAAFAFVDLLEKHQGQAREVVVDVTGNEYRCQPVFHRGRERVGGRHPPARNRQEDAGDRRQQSGHHQRHHHSL